MMNVWVIAGYALGVLAIVGTIFLIVYMVKPSKAGNVPSLREATLGEPPSKRQKKSSPHSSPNPASKETTPAVNVFETGDGIASRESTPPVENAPSRRELRKSFAPVASHRVSAPKEFTPEGFSIENEEREKTTFSWDD